MIKTQSTSEGGKSLVVLFYHQSDEEISTGIAEVIKRSGNGKFQCSDNRGQRR